MSVFLSRCYDILVNQTVRNLVSIALGLLVYFVVPRSVPHDFRVLLAWDTGILCLLSILLLIMAKSDP